MFKICDQKGFHMTFANGWTVSVQFGYGNYGSNYSFAGKYDGPVPPAETAEVAAWRESSEGMAILDSGDSVAGHYTPDRVLALMTKVASLGPDDTEIGDY